MDTNDKNIFYDLTNKSRKGIEDSIRKMMRKYPFFNNIHIILQICRGSHKDCPYAKKYENKCYCAKIYLLKNNILEKEVIVRTSDFNKLMGLTYNYLDDLSKDFILTKTKLTISAMNSREEEVPLQQNTSLIRTLRRNNKDKFIDTFTKNFLEILTS